LAHVLRGAVVPAGYSYPKAARARRDWWRKRAPLVRQQTSNVLRVQNRMARHTGARFRIKRMHALTQQALQRLLAQATQGLAVLSSLTVLDWLRQQSTTQAKTVPPRRHRPPADAPVLPVQGLGTLLAHTIALATGDSRRFPPVGHSASYGRGVDSPTRSHSQRTGTGTGNHGPPSLAWAYREAAQCALRLQPAAQRFSQRQRAKSRNHPLLARNSVAPKRSRAGSSSRRARVPCEATTAFGCGPASE
jgi:transposase